MVSQLQAWIVRSIGAGAFAGRADVVRFALTRSVFTTTAALALNFLVYQLFGHVGFATLPTDPLGDAIVTACVAAAISFLAFYLVGQAILELAISRDAFEHLSRIDPLTGLLNRRAFTEEISAHPSSYVIGVLDIDRFKSINDTYGHSAGDKVLTEFAVELRNVFGEEALLARLGGEEFGVVIPDPGREAAMSVFDRARSLMARRKFQLGGHQISVTFSAGVARGGEQGYSIPLSEADKALYLAKAAGRNRIVHADDVASLSSDLVLAPREIAV